jgi:hypothetical protein
VTIKIESDFLLLRVIDITIGAPPMLRQCYVIYIFVKLC